MVIVRIITTYRYITTTFDVVYFFLNLVIPAGSLIALIYSRCRENRRSAEISIIVMAASNIFRFLALHYSTVDYIEAVNPLID
jgi:hypothetical protein